MERALQELNPEELGECTEDSVELQLTDEYYQLRLRNYELESQWLDYWSADLRSLRNNLQTLNMSPSEMLHLADPKRLGEMVRYWKVLDEANLLDRNKQRLVISLELMGHAEEMEATRRDIDINQQDKAVIQKMLDKLAETNATPDDPKVALIRELRASLCSEEKQMDELLRKGSLDIDNWSRYQEECRLISRRYAEGVKKLQELSNN